MPQAKPNIHSSLFEKKIISSFPTALLSMLQANVQCQEENQEKKNNIFYTVLSEPIRLKNITLCPNINLNIKIINYLSSCNVNINPSQTIYMHRGKNETDIMTISNNFLCFSTFYSYYLNAMSSCDV